MELNPVVLSPCSVTYIIHIQNTHMHFANHGSELGLLIRG